MLELSDVFAGYQSSRNVLCGVSLRVEPRKTVAIYGLNGCGKSTLLKVCAGLLVPNSGSVSNTFGRPGYLQQNPRMQLLASNVREELALSLRRLHSHETLDLAVHDWLNRFSIVEFASKNARDLSGGQQQIVALAAILCRQPSLLLLDEPDAFLDGRSANMLRAFVADHCKECAILWTHSRKASAPNADTHIELREGTFNSLIQNPA